MFGRIIDFGDYGPSHGLVIVDMQTEFLKNPEADVAGEVEKLIEKIADHVKNCISRGGEVILVEFENYGETVPPIIDAVDEGKMQTERRNSGNISWMKKNDNSLLSTLSGNIKNREINRNFLEKRKGKKYTVCGINAYFCLSECATEIDEVGCIVRVDVGLIMNANRGARKQKISKLKVPSRLVHAPAIYPQFFPLLRGKSFLNYL